MNRREWLRRAAVITAGVVAADQLELIEKLTHRRRLFAAWPAMPTLHGDGVRDDTRALQTLLDGGRVYDARTRTVRSGSGFLNLHGGAYAISDTIHLRRPGRCGPAVLVDNLFATLPGFSDYKPIFEGACVRDRMWLNITDRIRA